MPNPAPHHPLPPPPRLSSARRAFTLIELGISSSLMGVLMVSMASVVVLASKAIPAAGSVAETGGSATLALDQLTSELRCATRVTHAAADAIEFEIPDRNSDSTPETVRYAWAGAGSPLTRQYNGATPAAITAPLHALTLEYSRRKTTTTETTTTTWDSGEVVLSSFNGWLGLTPSISSQSLTAASWGSEAFRIDKVSLPADTTRLAITRVSFQARRPSTPTGTTVTVSIHQPTSNGGTIPSSTPIGTPCILPVSGFTTSFAWVDATFSDVVFPNEDLRDFCILVKGSGTSAAILRYMNLSTAPADNNAFRYTSNSGSSWLPSSGGLIGGLLGIITGDPVDTNDMPYFVYGSYQRNTTNTASIDHYFLASARVALQPGPESDTRIETGVEALNKPPIPAP